MRTDLLTKNKISWYRVEKIILRFIDEFKKSGYKPDILIGVGRGGSIVSGLLAGNMGYIPLAHINTRIDVEDGEIKVSVANDGTPKLAGLDVLIVVAELYSGEDMKLAKEIIKAKNPKSIKTLSILYYPQSVIRPDYMGIELEKRAKAPWRLSDNYQTRC